MIINASKIMFLANLGLKPTFSFEFPEFGFTASPESKAISHNGTEYPENYHSQFSGMSIDRVHNSLPCQLKSDINAPATFHKKSKTLKDYKCQYPHCSKSYSTAAILTEHVRSRHLKIQRFQCSVCLRRFSQKGDMKKHARIHSNIYILQCRLCNKAFRQSSNAYVHVKRVHPIHSREEALIKL